MPARNMCGRLWDRFELKAAVTRSLTGFGAVHRQQKSTAGPAKTLSQPLAFIDYRARANGLSTRYPAKPYALRA